VAKIFVQVSNQLRREFTPAIPFNRFDSLNLSMPNTLSDPDDALVEQKVRYGKSSDLAARTPVSARIQ
jgi:hypothetical protein